MAEKKKLRLRLGEALTIPTVVSNKAIIAYRQWGCNDAGWLHSVAVGYRWEGPVVKNMAPPVLFDGRVRFKIDPKHLGFYFSKEPHVPYHSSSFHASDTYYYTVCGVCSLFGRVVEHQHGYRAERARIETLCFFAHDSKSSRTKNTKQNLEKNYHCDVEVFDSLNKVNPYLKYMAEEIRASQ